MPSGIYFKYGVMSFLYYNNLLNQVQDLLLRLKSNKASLFSPLFSFPTSSFCCSDFSACLPLKRTTALHYSGSFPRNSSNYIHPPLPSATNFSPTTYHSVVRISSIYLTIRDKKGLRCESSKVSVSIYFCFV